MSARISGNLVVKSKRPPRSGSSLEPVEQATKFCFFMFRTGSYDIHPRHKQMACD